MAVQELFQTYWNRLEEARLYIAQGLPDGASELIRGITAEIEASDLPDEERERLLAQAMSALLEAAETEGFTDTKEVVDPYQAFQYGRALMDGEFWEEAIIELERAASGGYRELQALELCGDCAHRLNHWEDSIRYYRAVYGSPEASADLKKQILLKMARSSQALRKTGARPLPPPHSAPPAAGDTAVEQPEAQARGPRTTKPEAIVPAVTSLDQSPLMQLVGERVSRQTAPCLSPDGPAACRHDIPGLRDGARGER